MKPLVTVVLFACAVCGLGGWFGSVYADLTADQRAELERKVGALDKQASQYLQQRQFKAAAAALEEALKLRQQLYPTKQYPQGHVELATNLNKLGFLAQSLGNLPQAQPYFEQSLAMWQRLYPEDKFPAGHEDLARALNNLGAFYQAQGDLAKARPYLEKTLAMRQRLHPKEQFPQGHPGLVASLNNLASLLQALGEYDQARPLFEQAVTANQLLYPKEKYPLGHPLLAASLGNLGGLLKESGSYGQALPYFEQNLVMLERLYPKEKYVRGHPDVARALNNLGSLLHAQGEYARARPFYARALAMRRVLYPAEEFPRGHPELATSLNNQGHYLYDVQEFAQARALLEEALAMRQRLFPAEQFPQGHPQVAITLDNLGALLIRQGELDRAQVYQEQCLKIHQQLYAKERYPQGHPQLALSLNNLSFLLAAKGELTKARSYAEECLAMNERLYPKDRYPQGHPALAYSLNNLGMLLLDQGEPAKAWPLLERAVRMYEDLVEQFSLVASEVEALNFAWRLPGTIHGLLSISRQLSRPDGEVYAHVWRGKAALTRLLQRRQQQIAGIVDPEIRRLAQEVLSVRQQLAHLLLTPGSNPTLHRQNLEKLSARKEHLERQLAGKLPNGSRLPSEDLAGPEDLLKALPPRAVFIDLFRYVQCERDPQVAGLAGERRTIGYVAFVLCPGQPVRRVDLGPAQPIDAALSEWRREISELKPALSGAKLRRLVWEPLANHIPANTETVYVAPDGALARLPWAALPGQKDGTVLLEELTLAIVPHGPFLHASLATKAPAESSAGSLLVLGGVRYDEKPGNSRANDVAQRGPVLGKQKLSWPFLPGSQQEAERVIELAGSRPVRKLLGADGSSGQLLTELTAGKDAPRWIHLATHGFFADAAIVSALQIDENNFRKFPGGERAGTAARNPFVMSGLVLAGANLRSPENGAADGDLGGLLTAEAIAGLPLLKLDLVVLSACETGLGHVAGGEGVFGLQRAFHLAGSRNVVASLWKVNDEATLALMTLFYAKLWKENKPPIVALREAQLTLYRQPEQIKSLAQRGLKLDKPVPLPDGGKIGTQPHPAIWAAFMLSGDGR